LDKASTKETTGVADLVSRIIAGDREAEEELFHRYSRSMFLVINNIVRNPTDAEDLLHEVLITALRKIRQGDLNEPEKLSGFIRSIAKNIAQRHSRKATNRTLTNIEQVPPPTDPNRGPLEQLLLKEEVEIVRQVLGELTQERDRQIIIRYYIMEEDKETICANLGLTSADFSRVKFRALERFKELYEEKRSSKKPVSRTPGGR
jgi:RNA polymerase sigma-70 factor, ECF subfamily